MQIYRGHVLVCAGTGCVASGSRNVQAEMEKQLKPLTLTRK